MTQILIPISYPSKADEIGSLHQEAINQNILQYTGHSGVKYNNGCILYTLVALVVQHQQAKAAPGAKLTESDAK